MNSVLLTIDLTKAVADEAIERKDCVVVSYRDFYQFECSTASVPTDHRIADPIIFKGFKSLTLADTQQQSLLRLALEGISVYSPHTAVDATPGGLGDWLADIVTGTLPGPEPETHTANQSKEQIHPSPKPDSIAEEPDNEDINNTTEQQEQDQEGTEKPKPRPKRPTIGLQRTYSKPTYPSPSDVEKTDLSPSALEHSRSIIHPINASAGTGMGRLVKYATQQPLTHLIERIAHGVGSPKGFPVAIPQMKQVEDITIRTVGICAGSGHDVLQDVDADLLFTGELSHHDALKVTEAGKCVVTLFHSNTERGFLSSVLKLTGVLREEWERVRAETKREFEERKVVGRDGYGEESMEYWEDAVKDEEVLVEVSERDRDPFGIVILQSSEQVGQPI